MFKIHVITMKEKEAMNLKGEYIREFGGKKMKCGGGRKRKGWKDIISKIKKKSKKERQSAEDNL